MKPSPIDPSALDDGPLLILSDGKPGHVNQARAFARLLGREFTEVDVAFRSRPYKALSYIADRLGVYSSHLFHCNVPSSGYAAIASAGSETYYANRTLARRLGCRSVAIMLPRGYRLDFNLIVAQQHDHPPVRDNILSLPINLSFPVPRGIVTPEQGKRYISLIVGGDSAHQRMDADLLTQQTERIFQLFPEHRVWLTTSRRTPPAVEALLRKYPFERAIFYSQEPVNPIPDFLCHSEYVFLTADSSSMISEAVSFGPSCVEVLPSGTGFPKQGKFARLLDSLLSLGCLHLFDGSYAECNNKIDLAGRLKNYFKTKS